MKAYHFRTEIFTSNERFVSDRFYVPGRAIFYFENGFYDDISTSKDDLRNAEQKYKEVRRIIVPNGSYLGEVEIPGRTLRSAVAAQIRVEKAEHNLEARAKELFRKKANNF